MSTKLIVREFVSFPCRDLPCLRTLLKMWAVVILLCCWGGLVRSQTLAEPVPGESPYVVEGENDSIVYAVGQSLRINGSAKNGAVAFGGDVIVQGVVEGDVAAIGGSVIQLEGARIGGDVMVVGGSYRHADKVPLRSPNAQTIMVAGYEQELRHLVRNPTELLSPHWTARSIGFRILAILFWFVVSMALTAAMPGTISRGIARLQMTSLRVALIGFIGVVAIGPGTWLALLYLPLPVGVVIGLMAMALLLIAGLLGRVIIYAATGRWLQRKFVNSGKNSETAALLIGTSFWILLSSLPFVWPFIVAVIWVLSLGLALTARYKVSWKNRLQNRANSH